MRAVFGGCRGLGLVIRPLYEFLTCVEEPARSTPIAHQKTMAWRQSRRQNRQNKQEGHQNVEHDLCPIGFFDSAPNPPKMPLGLWDLRTRMLTSSR